MGYNATVVVMLDSLSCIAKDKDFGAKLSDAIMEQNMNNKNITDVMATDGKAIYCNAASVIEVHHADFDVYVKVGGNTGEVINLNDIKKC